MKTKAAKTKQFIIETVSPLFNKKGYANTSLQELTEATGLTKGAIYGNFENKEGLMLAAYAYHSSELTKAAHFEATTLSPFDRLFASIDFYRNNWQKVFETGGCPLMNAAVEADHSFPELKKQAANSFQIWAERWTAWLIAAQKSGLVKSDVKISPYVFSFISLIEGGILVSKTLGDPSHLLNNIDLIEKMINEELKL